MQILFSRGYSKSLLDAISVVLTIDPDAEHAVQFYDSNVEEDTLEEPIVFLFDECRKGVGITTRRYAEELGYRVFAYKISKGEKRKFFDDALTVLSLLPKAIDLVRTRQAPFLYTFRYKANKFAAVKLNLGKKELL